MTEGVFEHAFHLQEPCIFSHLLITKLYNHHYYPHFHPLSSEKLSKLLKMTKPRKCVKASKRVLPVPVKLQSYSLPTALANRQMNG